MVFSKKHFTAHERKNVEFLIELIKKRNDATLDYINQN